MDVAPQCVQCGTPSRGQPFCTNCGTPLSAPATTDPTVAHVSNDASAFSADGVPAAMAPEPATFALPPFAAAAQQTPAPPWVSAPAAAAPRARTNLIGPLVVAALLLSGWAIWRGVEQHTVSGTVLLVDSTYLGLPPGRTCSGEMGYGDLRAGAQVILMDGEGETLSTGRLSRGEFDGLGCVFSFELEDVPRAEFYGVSVASVSRGHLQYSYDELADEDWSLQLSIGDE